MDLEQRLRASLVAPEPSAMFTARVMARLGRGAARRRSSFIVIGTVLVVSAAAAMLAWQMSAVQPPSVQNAAQAAVSVAGPVEEPVMQAVPGETEPAAKEPDPAQPNGTSPQYSVLVMPLRHEVQDAGKRGPVEAFYAATLDELRKVPGLALDVSGDAKQGAGAQADYVLTITSLATRVAQSGGVAVSTTDGGTTYTALDGGMVAVSANGGGGTLYGGSGAPGASGGSRDPASVVWVEMKVESRRSAVSRYTLSVDAGVPSDQRRCNSPGAGLSVTYFSSVTTEGPNGGAVGAAGSGAMVNSTSLVLNSRLPGFNVDMDYDTPAAGRQPSQERGPPDASALPGRIRPPECMTPVQLAASQVEVLRLEVFPPEAAFQQLVVAQLSGASLDQSTETKALSLLQRLAGNGGARLDTGTLQAMVRFATGQSARVRASVWAILRFSKVSHPVLIAPLVESLRHDADQQVRLVALANLEENYSIDPLIRSAFESVGRDDPDPIVRVAARRALNGQAQWRDEFLAALSDAALPYEGKLAPLISSGMVISPPQQAHRLGALQEQQVLRPLLTLVRAHLRDPAHAKATREALQLLGSIDDPAVFELFMQLMRETSMLDREITVRANSWDASGPVTSWVGKHRNDPRVIASLPDVDPRLRPMIERKENPMPLTGLPAGIEPVLPSNLLRRMQEVVEGKDLPATP